MNYLAHLYFAEPTPASRIGNLMGDFYRGAPDPGLAAELTQGIRLHRWIDAYTDCHPEVVSARAHLVGPSRRYAGVILDVAFDHFLCRHWPRFHRQPLERFLEQVYRDLTAYQGYLPERMERPLERLLAQRWLSGYATLDGVTLALERMSRRLRRPEPLARGGAEVERHYDVLERCFLQFFPELNDAVARYHRDAGRSRGSD